MDWGFLYIIGKILDFICLKWARMTHLDTLNISYGQKKGRESNWQFDSRPLKVDNRLFTFRWCATYFWKALNKSWNFSSNLISIESLHTKLWAPKVVRVPTLKISGLPHGSPKTKWHLGVGLVVRHRIYYKREDGGFPQVWAVVSLMSPNLPMIRLSTKNVLVMYSSTCYLVLCRYVWVIDCFSFFLVPSRSSDTPFYPQKCYKLGSVSPIPYSFIVFTSYSYLNLSRSLGVRHNQ
jgi:hypothetical protein